MKIKKIAAATLVPAAVAGVTVSSWAAVQAATSDVAADAAAHQVREVRPLHRAHSPGRQEARQSVHAHEHASEAPAAAARRHHARHGAHAKPGHRPHAKPGHRSHARAAASPASPSSLLSGMSPFERCVAWRESGDNPTASSAGLFGILPSTWASLGYPGTAGQASVSMQKAAFDRLYAQYGTSPWAPYDGC
jgi:hypothetical protein